MPKKIIYLAPVDSMSGNLSGRQTLRYAKNNNPAWDAPEGQQYAKNYKPRFVASVRAKDGLQTFSTKTKSAVRLDKVSRRRMAAMAFSQAFLDHSTERNAWPLTVISTVQQIYAAARQRDASLTWRKFFSKPIYEMLVNRRAFVVIEGTPYGLNDVTVYNPFVNTDSTLPHFAIQEKANQVKFWTELSIAGVYFKISGSTGIATEGDTWEDAINNDIVNVLDLTIVNDSSQETGAVKMGTMFVSYDKVVEGEPHHYTSNKDQDIVPETAYYLSPSFYEFES